MTRKDLPPWAQSLLSRPLIEVRRGLTLSYSPPTEKSSVLVLTAPSGRFVDIRFSLTPDSFSTSALANEYGFAGFATAGMSEMTLQDGSLDESGEGLGFKCMVHVTWHHPIDSTQTFESDEADMFLLANGDTMEIGTMTNPQTGEVQLFKEYWTAPTPKPRTVIPCIVAECKPEKNGGSKGMIIRIGDYVQGIVQKKNKLMVERWTREGETNRWVKDERSTDVNPGELEDMPCQWMGEEDPGMGETRASHGRQWEVVESISE